MRSRLNIIWIVTTQWRWSALGGVGAENVSTPELRGICKEGTLYTQAVTPHPMGPQARASLLTGLSAAGTGVRNYWDELPSGTGTIAGALSGSDYTTAFFGKWQLSRRDRTAPLVGKIHAAQIVQPEHRGGFSFWEGFEGGFLLNDPLLHGSRLAHPTLFNGYQSDVLLGRAAEWLNSEQSRSTFCIISLEPPHPPYSAPSPDVTRLHPHEVKLRANVPLGSQIEARARQDLAGYYAHINATDRAIGRFCRTIDRTNTMLVFTSVHGDMHGSHGLFRKGWPYEESVRVPLIISGPLSDQGATDDTPISLIDLYEMTIAWAAGRAWRCERNYAQISMPSVTDIPQQCDRIWYGVRNSKEKLVLNADGSPWLCFNLQTDPYEMNNLVGVHTAADRIERLTREVALLS